MPKIQLNLTSQRGKQIDEYVTTYILESEQGGTIRDHRHLKPTSRKFRVDAAPGNYRLHLEIPGFRDYFKKLRVKQTDHRGVISVPIEVIHRCKDLPDSTELRPEQRRLLSSSDPQIAAKQIWAELSDNKCATFFQITSALTRTKLAHNRRLSRYIESVHQIGGARISNTIPDGNRRSATGWRLHVVIADHLRGQIEPDLLANSFQKTDIVVATHKKFGFTKSYRQKGELPHFQIVLNNTNSMADVDLDVEFHRSSPCDVFKHLRKKFPDIDPKYSC